MVVAQASHFYKSCHIHHALEGTLPANPTSEMLLGCVLRGFRRMASRVSWGVSTTNNGIGHGSGNLYLGTVYAGSSALGRRGSEFDRKSGEILNSYSCRIGIRT